MLRTKVGRYGKAGKERAALYEYFLSTHIHHVGNDSYYGQPFYLEDWQRKYLWNPILASGKQAHGVFERRFSTALIGMPRDWGKTEFACGLMLTLANMEPIYNGQYGIVAYNEAMGVKILKTLKAMVALDPDLKALWEPLKGKLSNRETGAEIIVFPYSENAVQSWHFNVIIADELHVWRNSEVWDAIQSGQKDIPNALCIGITTAGAEQKGFLWDKLDEGAEKDPTCYTCWIGAEQTDNVDDREVWRKLAMPSWVTVESIEKQRAKLTRAAFERYVLNRYPEVRGEEKAIKQSAINRCKKRYGKIDYSKFFTVAFDGAVNGDTLAVCAFQRQGDEDVFEEWAWQEPDESGTYDFMEVADVLESLSKKPGKPLVGGDPARMVVLMKFLKRYAGLEAFSIKQQPSIMCPACALLVHSIEGGNACLKDTPVLADHAGNCIKDENKAYGTRFTSKGSGKSKKHIDMAIAASMAVYIYENTEQPSDYMTAQFVF